ncbi:hypothetical protein TNIN_103451 [Trichonephila inaurata madagascariensis]|uniref:Uncharacterized protein n=1 Tax=Trichonephila inaurata madagascariensis TaxID=2747483 RepID=A0A8X7C7F3_9ARAC|nr:hypothetical protein TNIN_103451 [Trichonephila inaurata madagascariensis]
MGTLFLIRTLLSVDNGEGQQNANDRHQAASFPEARLFQNGMEYCRKLVMNEWKWKGFVGRKVYHFVWVHIYPFHEVTFYPLM